MQTYDLEQLIQSQDMLCPNYRHINLLLINAVMPSTIGSNLSWIRIDGVL
jgi:hypothetical protein